MDKRPEAKNITVYQCPECPHLALRIDLLEWHKRKHDPFYEIDRLWARELCWKHVNERKLDGSAMKEYYIRMDESEEIVADDILLQLLEPGIGFINSF